MVREINLRQVGGSIGATIPKDMADRMHFAVGDRILAIETADGVLFTPYREDLDATFAAANELMKLHRATLRKLSLYEHLSASLQQGINDSSPQNAT